MKQFLTFLVTIILLTLLIGCSEKDTNNPSGITEIRAYDLEQFMVAESLLNFFTNADQEDILEDNIEIRSLFSVLITAEDGWNWRNRNVRDLKWDEFADGYLLPADEARVYFSNFSDQGINTYNVKYAQTIDVFRAFQLVKPDGTIAIYELNAMSTEQINNHGNEPEPAIKLTDFIPLEITSIDSVEFIAADGYTQTYTSEEFNNGYWLVNSNKTIFPGFPDMPGSKKKFKFLQQLVISGTMQVIEEPEFGNYAEESDYQFTLPEDLSEFEYIIWDE